MAVKQNSQYLNYSQQVPGKITGLHLAAYFGVQGVVKALLDEDCLDFQDSWGRTPLFQAAANGHKTMVQLLLEQGAELESKDNSSQTPVFQAAANGHVAVVQLLLEQGANIDIEDKRGSTALQLSNFCSQEGVERLLIEKGASRSQDFYGLQALFQVGENASRLSL